MQRGSKMADAAEKEVSDLEEVARKGQTELEELEIVSWSDKLELEKQVIRKKESRREMNDYIKPLYSIFRLRNDFTKKSRASVAPSRVTRRKRAASRITFESCSGLSTRKRPRYKNRISQTKPNCKRFAQSLAPPLVSISKRFFCYFRS